MFILLLSNIVSGSSHSKCVPLNNQKPMIWTALINLHPNEYIQKFQYYPSAVKLDRCDKSCNILMGYLIKYLFRRLTWTKIFV